MWSHVCLCIKSRSCGVTHHVIDVLSSLSITCAVQLLFDLLWCRDEAVVCSSLGYRLPNNKHLSLSASSYASIMQCLLLRRELHLWTHEAYDGLLLKFFVSRFPSILSCMELNANDSAWHPDRKRSNMKLITWFWGHPDLVKMIQPSLFY